MELKISKSWVNHLDNEFNKPYFDSLINFLKREYETNTCYPPWDQIFSSFNLCSFENLKVVIIGQDPYHNEGQANGLCFSVNDDIKHPPSLINIFKEIDSDLKIPYPVSGNLERWARQGVLLLNATLSVRAHNAGSHQKQGWETFTDNVIKIISKEKENVIFMLWGGFAKNKIKFINTSKHYVLSTGHPSPLSANRGYWFGNKQFSKTNSLLEQAGLQIIDW